MRRTTRPRLLAIWLILGAASIGPGLVRAAALTAAPAGADDAVSCANASGDAAIAACTRAIDSGHYYGQALEKLYHDRAFKYYNNKRDNDRAIADYNDAIRIDPDNADAFYGRGNAWSEKFDDARAFADYDEAIRLDPNHAPALNNRGAAWLAMGQNDHAVADFSAAIRIDTRDADYYNNRGNAWHLKGDNDRAIADYNEAIHLNPGDPCPLYNRGNVWQAKGDQHRAFADYDEAIRLAPNYRCWGVKRKTFAPSEHDRLSPS